MYNNNMNLLCMYLWITLLTFKNMRINTWLMHESSSCLGVHLSIFNIIILLPLKICCYCSGQQHKLLSLLFVNYHLLNFSGLLVLSRVVNRFWKRSLYDRFLFRFQKRSFRFRKKRSFLKTTHSFWTFRKRIAIVFENDRFY